MFHMDGEEVSLHALTHAYSMWVNLLESKIPALVAEYKVSPVQSSINARKIL